MCLSCAGRVTAKVRSSRDVRFLSVGHGGTAFCRKNESVWIGSAMGAAPANNAVSGHSQTMPSAGGMALPMWCQAVCSVLCRIQVFGTPCTLASSRGDRKRGSELLKCVKKPYIGSPYLWCAVP